MLKHVTVWLTVFRVVIQYLEQVEITTMNWYNPFEYREELLGEMLDVNRRLQRQVPLRVALFEDCVTVSQVGNPVN